MIKFLCINATHILGGCQHIVPKYKDSSPTKRPESSVDIVYQQSKLNKDLVLANHICCCILSKLFQSRISQPRLCPKAIQREGNRQRFETPRWKVPYKSWGQVLFFYKVKWVLEGMLEFCANSHFQNWFVRPHPKIQLTFGLFVKKKPISICQYINTEDWHIEILIV